MFLILENSAIFLPIRKENDRILCHNNYNIRENRVL